VVAGLSQVDLPRLEQRDLFLLDRKFGIFYNNFAIQDVVDGSMIQCRNPYYVVAACRNSAWQKTGDVQRLRRAEGDRVPASQDFALCISAVLDAGDDFSM
jgi:hypothetical protein